MSTTDERECANCGDEVAYLSSRDWCDGCEAGDDEMAGRCQCADGDCEACAGACIEYLAGDEPDGICDECSSSAP